jgi:hypothetical protein
VAGGNMRRRGALIGFVVANELAGVFGGGVAQAAGGVLGFAVSPAFGQVEVRAGQPTAQYELTITNHNAVDQNFALSVVDFGSLDEEGGVAFLGTPANELSHKYGLASWMSLESNALFVPAGKAKQVLVTIANRPPMVPGGHYGAVLATAVTDTGEPVGDRVGVRQVLSSLVLAVKDGGAAADLRLVSQSADASLWHLPSKVEQRYQNAGNVHVTPRGVVAVVDPLGHVVARAATNEASGVILPESFRRYMTPLLRVGLAWLPGRYRVVSTYRYDGMVVTKTFTTGFWYAGLVVVWGTIVLAMAAAGALGWWLWRRANSR